MKNIQGFKLCEWINMPCDVDTDFKREVCRIEENKNIRRISSRPWSIKNEIILFAFHGGQIFFFLLNMSANLRASPLGLIGAILVPPMWRALEIHSKRLQKN